MPKLSHIRLSDLSTGGVVALGVAGAGVAFGVWSAFESVMLGGDLILELLFSAVVFALGVMFAYDTAKPEYQGTCDSCGEPIECNSSRDSTDEVIVVKASGAPRRLSLGPLSIVVDRQRLERMYCSGECVESDTRVVLDAELDAAETSPSIEPTRADGGRDDG